MADVSATRIDHTTQSMQSKWGWFLVLGIVLILCGALAVALPAVSTFAASVVLGVVLSIAGLVKIIQSLQLKEWSGFIWRELTGAVELVGGVLIYLNPLKGALAITLLIALVFLVQGLGQIALAFRVRLQPGWRWLLISGITALLASAALTLKLPYTRFYTPGTIAGISCGRLGLRNRTRCTQSPSVKSFRKALVDGPLFLNPLGNIRLARELQALSGIDIDGSMATTREALSTLGIVRATSAVIGGGK